MRTGVRRQVGRFGHNNSRFGSATGASSQLQFNRNVVQVVIRDVMNRTAENALLALSPGFVHGHFNLGLLLFNLFGGRGSRDLAFVALEQE